MAAKPGPSGMVPVGPSAAASNTTTQEYTVRVLLVSDRKKRFAMMRLPNRPPIDFSKSTELSIKMERENNFKEYKTASRRPKFGAGSEFGRDQKEARRRSKRIENKYNPDEQPWHLKIGSGKQAKKFRGVREGTIFENTSYYIFTQCADGAYEAIPVEEWYNFTPMIPRKGLNAKQAEEEFSRRDEMLKHVKNEDEDTELDEEEKAAKSGKRRREFMLTDMDEYASDKDVEDLANIPDSDDDEDMDEDDEYGGEKPRDDHGKGKKGKANAKEKNSKQNLDDEAVEESDDGDYDDYMSDSSGDGTVRE